MDDPTPEDTTARDSTQERRRLQRRAGIERARELVRRYVEGTPSMAEELLAERRAEAEK
jgi:hypothetical protein